jgi:pimeloyl-ACP methyl ester carboxylesterase
VTVPLDRQTPGAGTLPIAFELYHHTKTAQPAGGTIVVSAGGPGVSDTGARGLFLGEFAPLLDRWDLLLIDHRGTGRSAAIDCPALQHVKGDFLSAVRACAAHLGAAADRYGSGDVAEDVEAVRAALGIGQIDYVGHSYGATDVLAYAQRYPAHLRSAVLDSPAVPADATFWPSLAVWSAQVAVQVCRRSPSCAAAHAHPEATLAWLTQELRAHPFDGTGYDADGAAHRLHVDETAVFAIVWDDFFGDPLFLNQGELFAAADALRHGDRTPLLRLLAESPVPTDFGDPAGVSIGDDVAVYCSDNRFVWDKTAPEATRRAQYKAAVAAQALNAVAPYSLAAWTRFVKQQPVAIEPAADSCTAWLAPARANPPFAPDAVFAHTPALILSGALDLVPVADVQVVARRFPRGHQVEIANAGHITSLWSPCANAIELHFIATLRSGETTCAANTRAPFHSYGAPPTRFVPLRALASFPRLASEAQPAQVDTAADASTPADRQVATVAWLAVEDAVLRSLRMGGARGRGLRGGSVTVKRGSTATVITYHAAQFAYDVSVAGTARLTMATDTLAATVTVTTGGQPDGTLSFTGVLFDPAQPMAHVRGRLDGHTVALLTPTL